MIVVGVSTYSLIVTLHWKSLNVSTYSVSLGMMVTVTLMMKTVGGYGEENIIVIAMIISLTGHIKINLISDVDGGSVINYSPNTLILSTIRCIQRIDSECGVTLCHSYSHSAITRVDWTAIFSPSEGY